MISWPRSRPGLVHRSIGLGMVCQSWGGLLAGVPLDPDRARRRWPGANQGSMVIAHAHRPLRRPGAVHRGDGCLRPSRPHADADPRRHGQLSAGRSRGEKEADYRAHGIPVGEDHRRLLERAATELGVPVPWSGTPG